MIEVKVNSKDAFGDRMKAYEAPESERKLEAGKCVIVRLDGRSFSRFTKGFKRPYDVQMSRAMVQTAITLMGKTRPNLAYTQSDEITLGWFAHEDMSTFMFGGRIQKINSVLASLATAKFNQACTDAGGMLDQRARDLLPHFDARVYQTPNEMEFMNAFIWREQDCERNAIQSAARSMYSHKSLQGVDTNQMLERMAADGVVFEQDFPLFFRKGSYLHKVHRLQDVDANCPEEHRPDSGKVMRSRIVRLKDRPWTTTAEQLQFFKK